MNEILKHILTGKDNQTHDIAKWAWMLGFLLVGCSAIYLIYFASFIACDALRNTFINLATLDVPTSAAATVPTAPIPVSEVGARSTAKP